VTLTRLSDHILKLSLIQGVPQRRLKRGLGRQVLHERVKTAPRQTPGEQPAELVGGLRVIPGQVSL